MTLTKIWTTIGLQKQINCLLNGDNFGIKYIAVGDGAGAVPSPAADDTALVNEVWRGEITELNEDAPQFTAITYIPEDEGDFVIRELGVFDEDDNLLFVSQMDETPKKSTSSGLVKQIGLKVVFELQNGLNAVIVDPTLNVAASTAYVDTVAANYQLLEEKGVAGGYASLGDDGLVPESQLPDSLGSVANQDLSNLTDTGENKLNYNVFCINTGDTTDEGEPAFLSNVESSTITTSYSSSGISNFAADNSVYFDSADYADYVFTYDGSDWLLDDTAVTLSDYGITYDEKFSVSEYYTSDTITSVSLASTTFLNEIKNTAGTYTFTCSVTETTDEDTEETTTSTAWTLDDEEISLDDYGITLEGEPTDGDTITVEVTSLLAEDDTITVTVTQTFTLTTAGEFDVTTAAGKTYTITDTLTLDVTDYEDGTYNVYVNPVTLELSAIDNTLTYGITFPDDAADGDYLLNTAKVPYDLQQINITTDEDTEETTTTITTGLYDVYAGMLTVSSGVPYLSLNRYNSDFLSLQSEIGKPEITLSDELSDNEIWLEGAEVAIASYPLLYKIYGDTYGTASTDGYFVLPDFRERAIWGGEDFGYLEAGLPNLYGTFSTECGTTTYITGVFQCDSTVATSAGSPAGSSDNYIRFSASYYNSIYGNSDTVQPPAIKVRVKTRYI